MSIEGCFLRWLWVLLVAVALGCGSTYALRYTVEPGDTMASLSQRYGIDEAELRRFNQLERTDRLRPGDVIFVPGARTVRDGGGVVPATPPQPPGVIAAVPAPPVRKPPATKPAAQPAQPATQQAWVWPVVGEVLRGFGVGPVGDNPGIDIGAAVGTDVAAVGAGEVTYAGKPAPAYGTIVIVGHSGGVFTVYSKLSEASVHKGDRVVSGQVLGRVARGGGSGPSHLHFEVRRDQQAVDPLLFLPPR